MLHVLYSMHNKLSIAIVSLSYYPPGKVENGAKIRRYTVLSVHYYDNSVMQKLKSYVIIGLGD